MSLFAWAQMDAAIILFFSIAILKYFINKESGGLKWIVSSALFILIEITVAMIDWMTLGFSNFQIILNIILNIIASILMIIGSIKLILELFE